MPEGPGKFPLFGCDGVLLPLPFDFLVWPGFFLQISTRASWSWCSSGSGMGSSSPCLEKKSSRRAWPWGFSRILAT